MPAKYTIRDLERLSGIKAHTLRIWEQRYGILAPERTATNIRWYSAEELKKLLNISMLNNHGIKISRIAQMSVEEITRQAVELIEKEGEDSEHVTSLVIAAVELDEARFEKIFSGCILRQGFENTVHHIILPLLRKIGLMWQTGSIHRAQEHFVSSLIRQKLIVAIDSCIARPAAQPRRFMLFLPNGELHEIALLYYHYLLKSRGHESIYLGQSVPFDDLGIVCGIRNPDVMLTVFTGDPRDLSIQEYIFKLHQAFPDNRILVSGQKLIVKQISLPDNVVLFNGPEDLLTLLG